MGANWAWLAWVRGSTFSHTGLWEVSQHQWQMWSKEIHLLLQLHKAKGISILYSFQDLPPHQLFLRIPSHLLNVNPMNMIKSHIFYFHVCQSSVKVTRLSRRYFLAIQYLAIESDELPTKIWKYLEINNRSSLATTQQRIDVAQFPNQSKKIILRFAMFMFFKLSLVIS